MDKRQLGGVSMILGNAALFANGLIAYKQGEDQNIRNAGAGRMVSAALYSGSGIVLAKYGNLPIDKQLEKLETRLASFMKQEGVSLDAEQLKKANSEQQKSTFAKLEDYAYDHPIEVGNIYNVVAATGMLGSGVLRRKAGDTTAGNANLANYVMLLAGALASSMIPEKTHAQVVQQGQDGTLWGKVQEQPLNYAVWPYFAADLSYGAQAKGEYEAANKMLAGSTARKWAMTMPALSAFTMASALAGDVLTGFSSKKAGGDAGERNKAQELLVKDAASILSMQPLETQQLLAHKAAEYLTKQQGLRMVDFDVDELTSRIMGAVATHEAEHPEITQNVVQGRS